MKKSTRKKPEKFMLSGKAYYADMHETSKYKNKDTGMYRIGLLVSDAEAKKLKGLGVSVKNVDEGLRVSLSSKFKPVLIDGKRNPVTNNSNFIGNGSELIVETFVYDRENEEEHGKGLNLGTVQIKTLIKYEPVSLDNFSEISGGYEAETQEHPDTFLPGETEESPFDV